MFARSALRAFSPRLGSSITGPMGVATRSFALGTDAGGGVYHAGLRYTEFTNKLVVDNESQVIPIFRVLNYDGTLEVIRVSCVFFHDVRYLLSVLCPTCLII